MVGSAAFSGEAKKLQNAKNEALSKFGLWTMQEGPSGGKGANIFDHAIAHTQQANGEWVYTMSVLYTR